MVEVRAGVRFFANLDAFEAFTSPFSICELVA